MDMSRLQATSLRIVRRMLRGAMWLAGLLLFAWAVGAVYYIEFFPWPVSGLFAIAYIKELLNRHPRANEVIVETTEILTPFPLCFSVPLWSHAFSHCRAPAWKSAPLDSTVPITHCAQRSPAFDQCRDIIHRVYGVVKH